MAANAISSPTNDDTNASQITSDILQAPPSPLTIDTLNEPPCIPPSNTSTDEQSVPVPPPTPPSGISIQAHKLWIGNLDKRLTEQNILKFVTPFGKVVSFKYLLHTSGIEKGEPRGYCFVEYSTREEAEKAKSSLHGKSALRRKLLVDWARPDMSARKTGNLVSETWDPSSVSATLQGDASTTAKIAAIEAKLKQMEDNSHQRSSSSQGYNPRVQSHVVRSCGQRASVVGQVYGSKDKRHSTVRKMYRPNKPYSRIEIRTRK